jgi:allantoicase
VIVRLAAEGLLSRIEVDTAHFKGNFPESCAMEVCHAPNAIVDDLAREGWAWHEVLARTKLQAHTRHFYETEILPHPPATHARFRIFPDGGVSRLRLWGVVTPAGRYAFGLVRLNHLSSDDAERDLLGCCGSRLWALRVAEARPFASIAALRDVATKVWAALDPRDWLEAFAAHPRIGERRVHGWAAQEQSGASSAGQATLDALAETNRAYEAKFGHIYIVCATGKTADEMLAIAKKRLDHDAKTEMHIAVDEQRKIMDLRLEKLVHG